MDGLVARYADGRAAAPGGPGGTVISLEWAGTTGEEQMTITVPAALSNSGIFGFFIALSHCRRVRISPCDYDRSNITPVPGVFIRTYKTGKDETISVALERIDSVKNVTASIQMFRDAAGHPYALSWAVPARAAGTVCAAIDARPPVRDESDAKWRRTWIRTETFTSTMAVVRAANGAANGAADAAALATEASLEASPTAAMPSFSFVSGMGTDQRTSESAPKEVGTAPSATLRAPKPANAIAASGPDKMQWTASLMVERAPEPKESAKNTADAALSSSSSAPSSKMKSTQDTPPADAPRSIVESSVVLSSISRFASAIAGPNASATSFLSQTPSQLRSSVLSSRRASLSSSADGAQETQEGSVLDWIIYFVIGAVLCAIAFFMWKNSSGTSAAFEKIKAQRLQMQQQMQMAPPQMAPPQMAPPQMAPPQMAPPAHV
jgi:hypothetical protein